MPERSLGASMRLLLGIVGIAALLAGVVVVVREMLLLARGSPGLPTLAPIIVSGLAMFGGLQLVRGALRGRIEVRRTTRRSR